MSEGERKRFQERKTDGRKLWKLTLMDGQSYSHWYDYSRRDAMRRPTPKKALAARTERPRAVPELHAHF
jgi:polyphosphate kinase 2 (PPK2 family)